ncbi:MAG: carboxypeptidase regulatory-like domain-containing protein [Bacteroidia bacterium]|nr:carboxypeptidase regulatory-like domain-containing protein [Bacteroidia bacterium]
MKILITLLVASFFFFGCKKEEIKMPDNMNVTLSSSGSLKVKVVDISNNPLANAKVIINQAATGGYKLFEGTTDNTGLCNVGALLENTYNYVAEVVYNNKKYGENQYFQIIAGHEKNLEVCPLTNVGKLSVTAIDLSQNPISNLKVALIPYFDAGGSMSFTALTNIAIQTETTNSEGKVSFNDIPADYGYYSGYLLLFYYDSTHYQFISNQAHIVTKNNETSATVTVDL